MKKANKFGRLLASKSSIVAFGALAVAALTPNLMANSLTLSFDGFYFGNDTLTAQTSVNGGAMVYAGALRWTDNNDPSKQVFTMSAKPIKAAGQTSPFTIGSIGSLFAGEQPNSTSNTLSLAAGNVGSYRGGLLQDLYNKYWEQATASRTESAAFQLAAWELLYETKITQGASYTLDVTIGGFRVLDGSVLHEQSGDGFSAAQLANLWLESLASVEVTNLRALLHTSGQDQLFVMVPLPPALAMAGLGVFVCGMARRRLLRNR